MKEFLISLMVIFILVGIAYAGGEDFLSAIQAMQAMRDVSKSEAIMLNPEAKAKLKTVYVEVSNSSSIKKLAKKSLLKDS